MVAASRVLVFYDYPQIRFDVRWLHHIICRVMTFFFFFFLDELEN